MANHTSRPLLAGAWEDGKYNAGVSVTINAKSPQVGQTFDKWVIVSGNPQITDINSSTTTLIMPSGNVEISALFKSEMDIGCGSLFQ